MEQISDNILRAENWLDLQHFLFKEYEEEIGRFRSGYAYRGVPDCDFSLRTSLQRVGRKPSEVEEYILRNFKKYSPINTMVGEYNNIWNWIAIGQHHGLPTRFLDWTFSPNVALHFITEEFQLYNRDGAIWMLDFIEMRNLLPEKLQNHIFEKGYLTLKSSELSELIGNSIPEISQFKEDHGNALMFMEPPSIDDRMVNQFALFSLMLDPDTDKLEWLKDHPKLYKKIIIPADIKWGNPG